MPLATIGHLCNLQLAYGRTCSPAQCACWFYCCLEATDCKAIGNRQSALKAQVADQHGRLARHAAFELSLSQEAVQVEVRRQAAPYVCLWDVSIPAELRGTACTRCASDLPTQCAPTYTSCATDLPVQQGGAVLRPDC
jgi:hypothetical protein